MCANSCNSKTIKGQMRMSPTSASSTLSSSPTSTKGTGTIQHLEATTSPKNGVGGKVISQELEQT